MSFILDLINKSAPIFEKGGKLEKLYPVFEAGDTILFTPSEVTKTASHVRDGLDLKRLMITVVFALVPCIIFAMYNTGYQIHSAYLHGATPLDSWQTNLFFSLTASLGQPATSTNALLCILHGALYFVPILLTTFAVGTGAPASRAQA